MPVTTNTRKLAALLGASGAGIGTDGLMQPAGIDADMASQAELDALETETDEMRTNIALVAFKAATAGSLAKYNLQDQVIDEYTDATGIDGTPSTNHTLTGGVYSSSSVYTVTGGRSTENPATVGDYKVHTFLRADTGTNFVVPSGLTLSVEYLVVGGGGSGGAGDGGGGGAGGYRTATGFSVPAGSYTVTVGLGGLTQETADVDGNNGGSSVFSTITSAGGGGGGAADSQNLRDSRGNNGGSGGGSGGYSTNYGESGDGNTPSTTPSQGNDGGASAAATGTGGGGGGSSAVGYAGNVQTDTIWGKGGAGTTNTIRAGSSVTYAIGGNGDNNSNSRSAPPVDTGNGGNGVDTHAGGSGNGSGPGANGIVIIKYLTSALNSYSDITLQSTDTEAETQPTKADMVMLVEDAGSGVATLGTHIKGYISRDSGTTFTEGTLVDEGDWGTDKRILAFHDLDISGQPADQTMCYKITTHSQSAVYNTKIHATSIGWK